jgi:hypothetical protein
MIMALRRQSQSFLGDNRPKPQREMSVENIFDRLSVAPPFSSDFINALGELREAVGKLQASDRVRAGKLLEYISQTETLWRDLNAFDGQRHISLFMAQDRIDYFREAIDAIAHGRAIPEGNNKAFLEDSRGTPFVWHDMYAAKQERIITSCLNQAFFRLSASLSQFIAEPERLKLGDLNALEYRFLSDVAESGREIDVGESSVGKFLAIFSKANGLIRASNKTRAISYLKRELSDDFLIKELGLYADQAARVSVRAYSDRSIHPSENDWSEVERVSNLWAYESSAQEDRREGYNRHFTMDQLKDSVVNYGGTLLTECLDGQIAYFALIYSDPKRIPAFIAERVAAAENAGYLDLGVTNAWGYLAARDPVVARELFRVKKLDWYAQLVRFAGDVALAGGAEHLSAWVLESNASAAAHERAGLVDLRTSIIDDKGFGYRVIGMRT